MKTRAKKKPTCCISEVTCRDSSYLRYSLPVLKRKTLTRRSWLMEAKSSSSGEKVMWFGIVRFCGDKDTTSHKAVGRGVHKQTEGDRGQQQTLANSKRSVSLFSSKSTFLGNSRDSGDQYSISPFSSADTTTPYFSLY